MDFEVGRQHDHLCAGRAQGRRRARRSELIVAARGDKPFTDLADFAGRINPRAVNKRVLESLAAAGAFDALEADRARAFAAVDAMLAASAARARDAVARAERIVRRTGGARAAGDCRRSNPGCRPSGCRRNTMPSASSSPAIRSTITPRRSSGCACSRGRSLRAR